ncbi:MAG: GDP-mannose 4,6-dehydratase [Actinobacteria bacterium]|nr:GDP-mannose 4,6-dehydratase [Actinomycetota bacterium]
MTVLVTGAAGFIGSTLVDRLLADGHRVRGLDRSGGGGHLAPAARSGRFELVTEDLRGTDLRALLDGVDAVFHLAARPGVRHSWTEFDAYVHDNVLATHRLLEACRQDGRRRRVVYASSSSVYGDAARYPCQEDDPARPRSPYGVTKLAAEDLVRAYAESWGLPTVALRLFTVYGPRQRPDMAFHRLCRAALGGPPFPRYGDGRARRDFTYVDDVVEAVCRAAWREPAPGSVINIAGGGDHSLAEVLELAGELTGHAVPVDPRPEQPGDVRRTGGDVARASRLLGWAPSVDLRAGLERQLAWHRADMAAAAVPEHDG